MRLSHHIQYISLISVAWIICILPLSWAMRLGEMIGLLGWALRIRRKLVLSNIAVARPDADPAELKRIGKQAARNFGRTVTEFIRYRAKDREKVVGLVHFEGLPELKA
ncbi:MAG: hypothetical protein KJT03_06735, partial [Verrucomicrobiae bacterium]|nr:hypothetical protein [Verrucomicrobiae bacterium]